LKKYIFVIAAVISILPSFAYSCWISEPIEKPTVCKVLLALGFAGLTAAAVIAITFRGAAHAGIHVPEFLLTAAVINF